MANFELTTQHIKDSIDALASRDKDMAAALSQVGYPAERDNPQGFLTLMRVMVGQQVSVKAAAAIWGRVLALSGDTPMPEFYTTLSDEELRGAGLSRQKVSYVRSLCTTILDGTLDFDALQNMTDEDAVISITKVKGLGVWSAHMYLMFSLGRADIMPVGDLAVRVGIGRIIGKEERPTEKECAAIAERWAPYRSSVALMAWHFYANAPL
ncbi:MAG: hypothetical protein COB37_04695 [Kordiimonadales bacterium]|nr:MAG: hypothetical protein COB37_04695 [Kordiimonadales bacterium]